MPTVKQGKNPKQYPPCNRAFALRMMHPTQYVEGRISPLDRALKPIKDSFKKSSKSKRKDKSNHQSHENSDQLSSSGLDDDSSFEVYSPTDDVDLHKDFERFNGKVKRQHQQQQQHQKHYEQQQQHYQQQRQQQQQQQHYQQQQQHEQQQQHHYHQQQHYQQQQQEEDIESQNASRYNIKYDRRSNRYYRMNNDNSYATMENIYEEDETDDLNQQQVNENTFYKHNDNRMDTVNESRVYHHRPPNTENQPRANHVPWDTHGKNKDNLHHDDDDDHVMFVTSNGDTVKLRKKKSSSAQAHIPAETSSIADDIRAERFGKRLSLLCHMLAEKYPEDFHILELLVELQVSNEKREKEMNQSVSDLKDKVNSLEKRLNIIERLSLPGLQKALLPLANAFGSFYDGLKRSIDVANEQDGGCSSCENDLENAEIEDNVENKMTDDNVKIDDQLIDDEDVVDDDDNHDDDDDAKETEGSRNDSENCSDDQHEKENDHLQEELGNDSDKILKKDEDRVRNKAEDDFKEERNIVEDSERDLPGFSTEVKGIETEAAFERGKEEKDESDADRKSDYVIIGETEEKEPGIEQNEQKSTEISNSKTSLNTSDGEQPCNNDKDESCSTSEKTSNDQSNKRLSNYKSTESLKTFPNETSV